MAKREDTWWAHALLVGGCILCILPLLRIFSVSLRPGDKLLATSLDVIPKGATFESYVQVFSDTLFLRWLVNSLILSFLTAAISVALSATAAYALSRYRFPLRKSVMVFLLASQMIPVVVLLLPLYFLLQNMHLLNTYSGLITATCVYTIPFSVWILKGYFDTIPRELEEAGKVDGLSDVGAFWRIVVPLSVPGLSIAGLFSFTTVWNEYIVARVILQESEFYTWPIGLFELQGDFNTRWGMFAASSVMVTIPVLGVFLYSSRWLLSGLTAGSVKG
ncbi:MAG: carbohydrate ABC transporter permease [Proteobacteria bacterium]|nr:carbohydrate ABC transporter permease [Pseudomonadota bacterium]